VNRPRPTPRKISRPLATLLVVVFAVNVGGMVHALLSLLLPERFSESGAVALGTVVLAVAGVVAVV